MKVLVNDGISKSGLQSLENAGFEVHQVKVAQNQLESYINEHQIEALLVRSATKVRKELIDNCPSLRIIGRGGVGMDNIDVEYARSNGLTVINTPAASSTSVAELVFAHLYSGVRFLYDSNRNMPLEGDTHFKELKKHYSAGRELKGKTLGIIGLGRIGKEVAKLAYGNGMRVVATPPEAGEETNVTLSFHGGQTLTMEVEILSLDELLAESDYITLHVPAQPHYLISDKEIAKMKDGVGIINTARGGVVDEIALLKGLESEKIAFVALDVFENEPTPALSILMHHNISMSPHIGGATIEAQDRIGVELAEQLVATLEKA